MLARIASAVARQPALRAHAPSMTVARGMGTSKHGDPVPEDQGAIPTDYEQAIGQARRETVFEGVYPASYYDRDAVSALEEGTRENPIMVYSAEPERYVGVSLEEDAVIRWFRLEEGKIAYDPLTMNHFALRVISDAEIDEAIAQAEKDF